MADNNILGYVLTYGWILVLLAILVFTDIDIQANLTNILLTTILVVLIALYVIPWRDEEVNQQ